MFWRIEQIIVHFLLIVGKVFLLILVTDDSRRKMSGYTRYKLGYVLAIFIFLVVVWNFLVLLWALISYIMKCSKAKAGCNGKVNLGTMQLDDDYEQVNV